jgi:hypothetical protein
MDNIKQFMIKCVEFEDKHPVNFQRACRITDKFSIIAKMYDNMWLLEKLCMNRCTKFTDLAHALGSLEDSPDDNVLIQFTDIDLYCVFNSNQYTTFFETMEETADLYQIVLAGKKQKLVFACTDNNYFTELQDYAKNCFNADVSTSKNQITIAVVNSNEGDIANNYDKLYEYVSRQKNKGCLEAMKDIRASRELTYKYRSYSISNLIDCYDVRSIMNALRSITNLTVNGNVTINNINGNNNTIGSSDRTQVARNWVANNPPFDREITTDYYNRYCKVSDPIANNQFGKLAREIGYKTIQGRNKRLWVK